MESNSTHDYEALARAAYPTDGRLDAWANAFGDMVEAGAALVLLWGMRDDDKAREKFAKVRAEAEASACDQGQDPGEAGDKAVWQQRKAPCRSGWRKETSSGQVVRDHLAIGGWIGIQPRSVGMAFADVDEGGDEAADQAERKVGARALYRQPTATPGRLHLGWRADGCRGRKWRVDSGGGEIIRSGFQAVVWHPVEMLAAVLDARGAPVVPVERLCGKAARATRELDFAPTDDAGAILGAFDHAVEKIEGAGNGERNDTTAGQAWRAGLAIGNVEDADVDAARERVVAAAVDAAPDEASKAADTAGRQFDIGVAKARAGLRFEIRGPRGETEAQAAEDTILEDEVVTEDDVTLLEEWQGGEPLPAPVAPDMTRAGVAADVSRALTVDQPAMPVGQIVPQSDADRARVIRKGGVLGFDSHRLGASLVAFELAFPGWIVDVDSKGRPVVWEWQDDAGWREVPWKLACSRLAAYLEPRHYTLQKEKAVFDASGNELRSEQWKAIPRPTTGGSTEMPTNVARMMAGLADFYTETVWHDWNGLRAPHPDGTATDFLTGARGPQQRGDMAMKRTGVSPSARWRGTWFEERLRENVPSGQDRLLLQCLLGVCLMGINPGEAFIWLVGPEGSGKDGTAAAVAAAIGPDYTHAIPVGRILSGRSAGRSGDGFTQVSSKALLHEARLVVMEGEPDEEDVLDTGAYKSFSGGSASEGRRQGKDVKAQFRPGYTGLGTANRLPFVRKADGAVERRTYTIAFPVQRRQDRSRDGRIKEQMLLPENLADLLAFIVEGACLVAQCGGLPPRTEQQMRRAKMPLLEGKEDNGDSDRHRARDLHVAARYTRVYDEIRALMRERTVADSEGKVWLDERADGSDAGFLGAFDAILAARQLTTSAENRAKFLRRAGFEPVRRRGVKGSDWKMQCVVGVRLR